LLFFIAASSVPPAVASFFPRAFADAAAAEPGASAPEAEYAEAGARLAEEESKDARQAPFVAAARPDDCSVPGDSAAVDSVLDDCWAAPQVDDRSVRAAPPDDCSVRPGWAAADSVPEDSVLDDCWAAPQADDQFALVAPPDDCSVAWKVDDRSVRAVLPDDCSVRLESAAADSVPEDSVQDDCSAAL